MEIRIAERCFLSHTYLTGFAHLQGGANFESPFVGMLTKQDDVGGSNAIWRSFSRDSIVR